MKLNGFLGGNQKNKVGMSPFPDCDETHTEDGGVDAC